MKDLWWRVNRRFLIRYRIEYALALMVVYGVRAMSPAFAWAFARGLGRLLFRMGVRRKIALANLAVAFPEKTEEERSAIACRMYAHFASMVVDLVLQTRMLTRKNVLQKIKFTGWTRDYMDEHGIAGFRRRAQRVLFCTAHFGNWEIGSGFFGLLGVRIDPVYRAPKNPYLDKLLRRMRLDSQYSFIEKRGAVRAMLERFDANGNVGFLFDQEAVHGLAIPFFGMEARTHKTPAILARDHGIKTFFGAVVRRGDFLRYEARGQLLDLTKQSDDRNEDLHSILRQLVMRLENEIRRRPEQYLWTHRRWKRSGLHGEEHVAKTGRAAAQQKGPSS